jgi:hypothetical protein
VTISFPRRTLHHGVGSFILVQFISLIFTEGHELQVFENKSQRNIIRLKEEEVRGAGQVRIYMRWNSDYIGHLVLLG